MSLQTFENLPFVARRIFVDQLELSELLELSLMSPAIQRAAKRREIAEFKWLIMSPGHFVIHITELDPQKPKMIFKLSTDATKRIRRLKNTITLKCGPRLEDKIEEFRKLSKTLLKVVKPQKYHFDGGLYLDFVFGFTKRFDIFTMSNASLTLNQAKTILESIDVDIFRLQNTRLEDSIPQKFQMKHKNMFLNNCWWSFSFESFLDMKCHKIIMENGIETNVQLEDLLSIVKRWMDGSLENLEHFETTYMINPYKNKNDFRIELAKELRKLGTVDRNNCRIIVQQLDGKRAAVSDSCGFRLKLL
uniref:F-box domain-containing protein n=1 Tax=Caenorhabditis tropicalis TaxID=1561998 RepID=A0A1I7TTS0_9PELO